MEQRDSSALDTGAIPISLAARLTNVPSKRIRGWVGGYARSGQQPIIHRQLEPIGNRWALGFLDLLEVRFIDHFIRRGVPRPRIRCIAERLRRERRFDHPFALRDVRFRSGLGRIFAEEANEAGDRELEDLLHRQLAIFELLDDLLDEGLTFGAGGVPTRWAPRPERFPSVIVDPHLSFGQPVVVPALVPTQTLYEAVLTEGSEEAAAEWYDIAPELVSQAVRFELDVVQ